VASGVWFSPSWAQGSQPANTSERQWLSIPQIYNKLDAAGFRDIEKIERKHGSYKIRAIDRNGERVKLYLNPQTGEINNQRQKSLKDDKRNSADCNKRRCRDDLPSQGAATLSAGKQSAPTASP
jgi:hypothetical protein